MAESILVGLGSDIQISAGVGNVYLVWEDINDARLVFDEMFHEMLYHGMQWYMSGLGYANGE